MRTLPALAVVSMLLLTACASGRRLTSYSPVGAPAQYGDRTQDGIAVIMQAAEEQVRAAVGLAFVANGFEVTPSAIDGLVESLERRLEGDTTLVVRAEISPEDQSGGGVVVVFSGDYTLRGNSRRARVIQRPGERSALYARLGAIADSTRRLVKVVPKKDAAADE